MEPEYVCSAGHELKVLEVKKDGNNKGRQFLAGDECGAFRFLDQYKGKPPACTPKKEWKPEAKTSPPKKSWIPPKLPASPHSQASAMNATTDMLTMVEHKYKDLVDIVHQIDSTEDRLAWYFGLQKLMNAYFLSKLEYEK